MAALKVRPGILDIAPYVPGRATADDGARQIKLSSNETPLGTSSLAIEAYRRVATELHRYPDGSAFDLRAALGRHHRLDADRIVCGNGSDELISLLAQGYAGAGDEVLFTSHAFAMYPIAARAVGATPIAAPETDLCADIDALLEQAGPETRICYLANPNNPTGSYVPAEALRRLRAGLPDHCLLVIDAAYAEYITRNDYSDGVELVDAHDNVVMTRTFSKIYGLAAVRLGWLYGPAPVIDVLNRTRGPFNINAPAQAAGIAALEDTAFIAAAVAHNDRWRPWLEQEMTALGLKIHPSIANFVLVEFPPEPRRGAEAAYRHLLGTGIIPRQLVNYGLPDCLRFSVGLEDENHAVIGQLRAFVSGGG
ncbi:MAG: histidinol-phosphate transaminase [Alphaproteobacteria bacterium]|jgi:histidinol-phosphate aminotransferase|nr:histidinol-phosphate transaminase [Alphaproteobacteria bacterium]MDP6515113.1 histidinol-phosphate transaminase [Alphaproteobacteria bacterium]